MKKLFSFLACFLFLLVAIIPVHANEEKWKPNYSTKISGEVREMLKNLDFSNYEIYFTGNNVKLEYENAVKYTHLKTEQVITNYVKTQSFNQLFSDEYSWQIPISSNSGKRDLLIIVQKRDDPSKFEVLGITHDLLDNDPTYAELFNVESFKKTLPYGVDYKVFVIPTHYGGQTMVYYENSGKEYLIPYTSKSFGIPVKVKQVYEADTLMKEWDNKYEEVALDSSLAGSPSGYELIERNPGYTLEMYVILISIIFSSICALTISVLFVQSKKKRSSKN